MVDLSKAYCPDCGTAMDEEQGRDGSSEYDSLMQTRNLNQTAHLKLLEQFNLSSVFRLPPEDVDAPKVEENEPKPAKFDRQPEVHIRPKQPENIVSVPKNSDNIKPENANDIKPKIAGDAVIETPPVIENVPDSKKSLYIVLGAVLLLSGLALIFIVILGFVYWNY